MTRKLNLVAVLTRGAEVSTVQPMIKAGRMAWRRWLGRRRDLSSSDCACRRRGDPGARNAGGGAV